MMWVSGCGTIGYFRYQKIGVQIQALAILREKLLPLTFERKRGQKWPFESRKNDFKLIVFLFRNLSLAVLKPFVRNFFFAKDNRDLDAKARQGTEVS